MTQETLGTFLILKTTDKDEYIQGANHVIQAMRAMVPHLASFRTGQIDNDGLLTAAKETIGWDTKVFKPENVGFCRYVREALRSKRGMPGFSNLVVPQNAFHSGNENFPVKSYTAEPEAAYSEAASEGTIWKDAYGRSRLRALDAFLVGVQADIDAVRQGLPGAVVAEKPQEETGEAAE